MSPPASPHEAVRLLLTRLRPIDTVERVPLAHAAGRILAQDLLSDRPSPAVDVSSMDGYALDLASLDQASPRLTQHAPPDQDPLRIPVAGELRIGREPSHLPPGAALKIVTGAGVPPGASAVVRREDVAEFGTHIEIPAATLARLRPGENIRREGENLAAGDVVCPAGALVAAGVAGALAAFGVQSVPVRPRLTLAIVVTGDEVVAADAALTRWQLRDSNGPALETLTRSRPWIDPPRRWTATDDEHSLRDTFRQALDACDALITTGGVSMGDRDLVPGVLQSLGCTTLFHKLPQRPGKPILGAISPDLQPIFALPGNPVSVLVTARRIAIPVLECLAGASPATTAETPAPSVLLANADSLSLPLWWHRLVRLTGPGHAELVEARGSGDLVAAARADGFVEVPPGRSGPGPWPFFPW